MDVVPLRLATVSYPERHPRSGTGPVYAFLLRGPSHSILVDTGIGEHPAIDETYRPKRVSLEQALQEAGTRPRDVAAVINTHLHFDHIGGNRLFPGVPIYAQSREYAAAREPGHTLAEWIDFEGADYALLDGDADVRPRVRVIATPGHTPGHQSVVVETADGPIAIAGQIVETAAEFRDAVEQAEHAAAANATRLLDFAPIRVYFSHDHDWWEPGVAL